jgi:hypothetical protein
MKNQGREVPPDPFPSIDSQILGLTQDDMRDTSIEDARIKADYEFADALDAADAAREAAKSKTQLPDPLAGIDSRIQMLSPEQMKDTSIEDARTKENFAWVKANALLPNYRPVVWQIPNSLRSLSHARFQEQRYRPVCLLFQIDSNHV